MKIENIKNLWDATKMVPRENTYSAKCLYQKRSSQINNLSFHIKKTEKEKQIKPQVSRRKGIIKIKVEVNEVEKQQKKKNP